MSRYNHAGNLLADDKAWYSYDAFNRTTRVETFDGNIQVNRYDAEGLRHEMKENGSLVKFIFNPDREAVVEESRSSLTRYIRSSELIARNTDAARTYYHYVSDEMGSTTHIVDEDGIVFNHYDYDAWGNLQFAPHGGHWCVCQRPPGGAQRPPSLRYFDRLNNNNVMLRCPLHNSVG